MNPPLFDVYFSGELVPGAALDTVKKNLAIVFKADAARIDLLCNGQTHCLRKGLDQASAEKYQAVLRKAGAVAVLRTEAHTPPAAPTAKPSMAERLAAMTDTAPATAVAPAATPTAAPPTDGLSIAPRGSDLLRADERRAETTAVAAPNLDVITAYQPPPASTPVAVAPNVDHLSSSEGYDRLSEEAPSPPPPPDTSHLAVTDTGERLQPEQAFVPLALDLAHLALAPAGADLLPAEARRPVTGRPPDTSHLSVDRG